MSSLPPDIARRVVAEADVKRSYAADAASAATAPPSDYTVVKARAWRRRIKAVLDPSGIMKPGVVFEAPSRRPSTD